MLACRLQTEVVEGCVWELKGLASVFESEDPSTCCIRFPSSPEALRWVPILKRAHRDHCSDPEIVPVDGRSRRHVDRTARNPPPGGIVRIGIPSPIVMLSVCREDLGYLSVLPSLPAEQTIFEHPVGCWKGATSCPRADPRGQRTGTFLGITPDERFNKP